jgi:hypothetical protein
MQSSAFFSVSEEHVAFVFRVTCHEYGDGMFFRNVSLQLELYIAELLKQNSAFPFLR